MLDCVTYIGTGGWLQGVELVDDVAPLSGTCLPIQSEVVPVALPDAVGVGHRATGQAPLHQSEGAQTLAEHQHLLAHTHAATPTCIPFQVQQVNNKTAAKLRLLFLHAKFCAFIFFGTFFEMSTGGTLKIGIA